mmetsp:Transcript_144539/g.277311  ORF Transcript_144539/g.277311 Transcript_144539/m.277311 type:complete len:600 (-) Transcript_144539:239-2038(-)
MLVGCSISLFIQSISIAVVFAMFKIAIVFACLTYMGHGRRVQSKRNPLEPLAVLLQTFNPEAASILRESSPRLQAALHLRGGSAKPLQLITSSGQLAAPDASSLVDTLPASAPFSVVASVDGHYRGRRLLNALFDTDFDGSVQLGAQDAMQAGAWLASSQNSTGCLVLETRPLRSLGPDRSVVDSCKLSCFALALSNAIIIHSPCASPSSALVKEMYERVFSNHLAAMVPKGITGRTLLVHVSDPADALSEGAVRKACKAAWSTAIVGAENASAFSDLFDFEVVSVPAELDDAEGFARGVEALRATLAGAPKKLEGRKDFTIAAVSAWEAASKLDSEPSEESLDDRLLVDQLYQATYEKGQKLLRNWASRVAHRKVISHFKEDASAMLSSILTTFDFEASKCLVASKEMLEQRRAQLVKALERDRQELFVKQHRYLTSAGVADFKAQLLKVCGRGGKIEDWQMESLSRKAVKDFDAKIRNLADDETRGQLVMAFSKKVTELGSELKESPCMQLQALGAMKRQTKGRKPPRGIRAGLALVGAIRNEFAGGQGNIQTYAGYVDGLNTMHLMYANDGAIPDSSGTKPPPFRWQPKINFDISI